MTLIVSPPHSDGGIYPTLARVPGVQLLFTGPLVCMRHGISATLAQLPGRISFLRYSDADLISGAYAEQTVRAAAEIKRRRNAAALMLITCCQNAVIGTDYEGLVQSIAAETGLPVNYLEINRLFLHARHKGPLMNIPAGELIYAYLVPAKKSPRPSVNLIGPQGCAADGELGEFLRRAGVETVRSIDSCADFAAYLRMAEAHLNLALTGADEHVCRALEQRLHIPWLPLNAAFSPAALARQYRAVGAFLGYNADDFLRGRAEALRARLEAVRAGCRHALSIDGSGRAGSLALARWLLESGFAVSEVTRNDFSRDEAQDRLDLERCFPQLRIDRTPYAPQILQATPAEQRRAFAAGSAYPLGYAQFFCILDEIERGLRR